MVPALGCALLANSLGKRPVRLSELIYILRFASDDTPIDLTHRLQPLFTSDGEYKEWLAHKTNKFVNTIYVDNSNGKDGGEVSDSSTLEIERTCTEGEEPGDPPAELPKTGAADVLTGVIGIASVATAAGYYIASRKQ